MRSKKYSLGAADTSDNSCGLGIDDLSAADFEVVSPECPFDLTTDGYSMMLDGAGAPTTFGGNYYVNTTEETVTPTAKVRFDAGDGTWTTLAPRKYTLKYGKKTGDDSWEEYTDSTFGVDENGTATYRVSATGKETLYYSGTVDITSSSQEYVHTDVTTMIIMIRHRNSRPRLVD